MVVFASACPIHACTWTMLARLIASEPNVWRKSWKRSGRSPRSVARVDEPPPQGRRVEVAGDLAGEDRVVEPPGVVALPQARERLCHLGDQGDGARPTALRRGDGPVRERALDADRALREVDVARAQRDELSAAQAGEGGGQKQRRVLLGRRRARERVDLLG
jgi:hypothetical protein